MIRCSLFIIGHCWETLNKSSQCCFLTADCSDVWYSGRCVSICGRIRLYHCVTRVELGCSLDPSKMASNQIFSGYSTWETLWNDK